MLAANKFGDVKGGNKLIEKCQKLLKIGKLLKSQKLFKSQKLAKSRKKLLKNRKLFNFNTKKAGLSFLTPGTKEVFNCL